MENIIMTPTNTTGEEWENWFDEEGKIRSEAPSSSEILNFWLKVLAEETAKAREKGKQDMLEAQEKLDNSGFFERYIDPYVQKKVREERERIASEIEKKKRNFSAYSYVETNEKGEVVRTCSKEEVDAFNLAIEQAIQLAQKEK